MEKTHYMVLHRARLNTNANNISIKIRNEMINRVKNTKFLRWFLDGWITLFIYRYLK